MATDAAQLAESLRRLVVLAAEERLWAVVDGARDDGELTTEARDTFKQEIRSLFVGRMAPYLGDVAPYMVPIDPAGRYLENWAERWGGSVGILLVTKADPDALWQHLRNVFVAQDDRGKEHFFRYYDPRVIRVYLPTCTADEVKEFFGPVRQIVIEAENPQDALLCTATASGAKIDEVPVRKGAKAG